MNSIFLHLLSADNVSSGKEFAEFICVINGSVTLSCYDMFLMNTQFCIINVLICVKKYFKVKLNFTHLKTFKNLKTLNHQQK